MKFLVTILLLFSIAFSIAQKNSISGGNIDYDGTFKDGKLWNGRHYIYDEYGLLERIEVFKNGKFIGNGVFGGKEELLTDTINQLDKDGKKTGYWIITGNLSKEKGYADTAVVQEGYYKRSRKIGTWIKYWTNGNRKSEINYNNGRPYGKYISYFNNGNIKEKGEMKGGNLINEFWLYYSSGCMKQQALFNEHGQASFNHYYFDDCDSTGSNQGTMDTVYVYNPYTHDTYQGKDDYHKPELIYCDTCTTIILKTEPQSDTTKKIQPPKYYKDGYHKVYNDNADIWLDGEFKAGRLFNGKYYVYDEFGLLDRIEVYKKGKYVGNGVL